MKEIKDVLNLHDIPNIVDYLDCVFSLQCYEKGDDLQCYEYKTDTSTSLLIDMHSDETLIKPYAKLMDIITQENIEYLCFSIWLGESEKIDSWDYRPLIPKNEKKVIIG